MLWTSAAFGQTSGIEGEPPEKSSEPNKGVEILRTADEAIKAVKLVSYDATSTTTRGENPPMVIEGRAVIAGDCPLGRPERFRFEARFKGPDTDKMKEVIAGSDGETYFLVDPAAKLVYADLDPAVIGSDGATAGRLSMGEYCHPTPFSDEINATRVELVGKAQVGDENCFEIHVQYASVEQRAKWFFSERDFLPRQVIREFTGSGGRTSSFQLTLRNVVVNPETKTDPFKLVVPEGFTKTDEFAPMETRLPR